MTSKFSFFNKLSPSTMSFLILVKLGSCTDNASNESKARRKLPFDNLAKRI